VFAIEWHARLWMRHGVCRERCERLIDLGLTALDADYYGEPRPIIGDDPEIARMIVYLDEMFSSPGSLVSFS